MSKYDTTIYYIEENDLWWTKEDPDSYDYLKHTNSDMMSKITPYLKDKKVAIQAGAHCGFVIRELKKYFETIYTFEPNSSMFLCTCLNNPESNIYKLQACLGNEHKLVNMINFAELGAGADYVEQNIVEGTNDLILAKGKIPMLMIDDLNLNQCDLIELDIEGFEYKALLGAKLTVEKFKPLLCLEKYWGYRAGVKEGEMEKLLNDWGYKEVDKMLPDYIYKFIE
jgi:FkbM family methyltransferase